MTADAENIGVLEGRTHTPEGKALRAFDIHLQKIDVADVERAAHSIHSSGADRESMPAAQPIQEVIWTIIDHFDSPRRLGYSALQRAYIWKSVVAYQGFDAAKSPGMGLYANYFSVRRDSPREGQGLFANASTDIDNDVARLWRVSPEEVPFRGLIQKPQI